MHFVGDTVFAHSPKHSQVLSIFEPKVETAHISEFDLLEVGDGCALLEGVVDALDGVLLRQVGAQRGARRESKGLRD